jgi:NADPH:quinone reductase-like Zn-dependent oxidoreductase
VKRFQPGDAVFGDLSHLGVGFGGFAEYVCAPERALARKPECMTFEQAAAIPEAGTLAYQVLVARGPLKPRQKVLINGAGGGVGTLAIQIAKAHDVEVTGVDLAEKLDLMRSIGYDHVIDYQKEDFTKRGNATTSFWIPRPIGRHSTTPAPSIPAGRTPPSGEPHTGCKLYC